MRNVLRSLIRFAVSVVVGIHGSMLRDRCNSVAFFRGNHLYVKRQRCWNGCWSLNPTVHAFRHETITLLVRELLASQKALLCDKCGLVRSQLLDRAHLIVTTLSDLALQAHDRWPVMVLSDSGPFVHVLCCRSRTCFLIRSDQRAKATSLEVAICII